MCLITRIYNFSDISKMEHILNRMFLECLIGLTKESCCYGNPVNKELQISIFGECHALCFSENKKGISQIYPKIEDIQSVTFWLN